MQHSYASRRRTAQLACLVVDDGQSLKMKRYERANAVQGISGWQSLLSPSGKAVGAVEIEAQFSMNNAAEDNQAPPIRCGPPCLMTKMPMMPRYT